MISDHQKTVSSVTRAWGWSSADTEHLSRPGQRAGKPGLVTSVTSHSALCFRSQIRVSRHRPMMKWALGGASGALHSVGSWRAERRQSLAWSHSPPPQKISLNLFISILSGWVSHCLSHGQAAPPHYFCTVCHFSSLIAAWKVRPESHKK